MEEITHLLFEVSNSKFISKCEEVKHIVFYVVIFQVIHQVSAVSLKIIRALSRALKFDTFGVRFMQIVLCSSLPLEMRSLTDSASIGSSTFQAFCRT